MVLWLLGWLSSNESLCGIFQFKIKFSNIYVYNTLGYVVALGFLCRCGGGGGEVGGNKCQSRGRARG